MRGKENSPMTYLKANIIYTFSPERFRIVLGNVLGNPCMNQTHIF